MATTPGSARCSGSTAPTRFAWPGRVDSVMTIGGMRPAVAVLALAVSMLGAAVRPDPARVRDQVRAWRQAHQADVLREFAGLLAVPNLASDAANIRRNAERIVTMIEQ